MPRPRHPLGEPSGGLVLLAAAITSAMLMTTVARADGGAAGAWPTAARSTASTVALQWSANVPAPARLGVEPLGRCRRLDAGHAACPIAIVVLARDGTGPRPWRCSATVLVARTGGELAGQRTSTRCAPFPSPAAAPDPAASIGAAVALDANGDVACLAANDGRVTCVMSSGSCIRAASVPLSRPARAVAIGAQLCPQRRASSSA